MKLNVFVKIVKKCFLCIDILFFFSNNFIENVYIIMYIKCTLFLSYICNLKILKVKVM